MTIRGVAVAATAALLSACGSGQPHSSPLSTYTLSGAVSEMTAVGPVPIGGARIEETRTHQRTTTDGGGFYILYGLYAGISTFRTSKSGYVTDTRDVRIAGDVRLSIRLVPAPGVKQR